MDSPVSKLPREQLAARLTELTHELEANSKALREASAETEAARRRETEKINALNRTQKEFDDVVAALKQGAQWNTTWHSQQRKGVPIE